MISWNVSSEDSALIEKIVYRAANIWGYDPQEIDIMDLAMDITAVHANGNSLKLNELLAADQFNFLHDVYGITSNIDRDTGKLSNYFRPRFLKND